MKRLPPSILDNKRLKVGVALVSFACNLYLLKARDREITYLKNENLRAWSDAGKQLARANVFEWELEMLKKQQEARS